MATDFAHAIRAAELERTIPLLPTNGSLLEFGAGDGWQAKKLQDLGFVVRAVDVNRARAGYHYFPVTAYDGQTLPFDDHSFDAVYSSNVMEHVSDFGGAQRELARVLRSGGVAVHCVPSAVWRLWTSIGHPLYALRLAARLSAARISKNVALEPQAKTLSSIFNGRFLALLRLALVSPRHGEHGTFLGEHQLFSRRGWEKRFRDSGWRIMSVTCSGIFYTGNELMGLSLSNRTRRLIARLLGSSTLIFVVQPQDGQIV